MQVLDEIKKETFGNWNGDMPKWAQVHALMNHVYTQKSFDQYIAGLDIDVIKDGKEVQAVYESFVPMTIEERFFEFVIERDDEQIERSRERSVEMHKYAMEELQTGKFLKNMANQSLSEDEG